jgi:hypothetical protein
MKKTSLRSSMGCLGLLLFPFCLANSPMVIPASLAYEHEATTAFVGDATSDYFGLTVSIGNSSDYEIDLDKACLLPHDDSASSYDESYSLYYASAAVSYATKIPPHCWSYFKTADLSGLPEIEREKYLSAASLDNGIYGDVYEVSLLTPFTDFTYSGLYARCTYDYDLDYTTVSFNESYFNLSDGQSYDERYYTFAYDGKTYGKYSDDSFGLKGDHSADEFSSLTLRLEKKVAKVATSIPSSTDSSSATIDWIMVGLLSLSGLLIVGLLTLLVVTFVRRRRHSS